MMGLSVNGQVICKISFLNSCTLYWSTYMSEFAKLLKSSRAKHGLQLVTFEINELTHLSKVLKTCTVFPINIASPLIIAPPLFWH